jgi:hypothetical protein
MSNLSCRSIVVSFILAALPAGLYAVDGVVLFDQSHALAGGVTPGDAPGFPVTISQPGSYRLSGNLTVPDMNTTAIQITSDAVFLDLNGFSIIGPVVCTFGNTTTCPAAGTGVGVDAVGSQSNPGPRNIRVFNGSVRGMGNIGLRMTGDGSVVERVSVSSNPGGGMIIAGVTSGITATLNGAFGIFAITVRDSIAVNNAKEGIQLDGSGGVAIGNIASFNGGDGISAPNGTVIGNTVVRNGAFGITSICPSSIVNNTIVSNTQGTIQAMADGGTGCIDSNNAKR